MIDRRSFSLEHGNAIFHSEHVLQEEGPVEKDRCLMEIGLRGKVFLETLKCTVSLDQEDASGHTGSTSPQTNNSSNFGDFVSY